MPAKFRVGEAVSSFDGSRIGRIVAVGPEDSPQHYGVTWTWPSHFEGLTVAEDVLVHHGPDVIVEPVGRPDVTFTREGGFHYNGNGQNPFVPPPPPPRPVTRTYVQLSHLAQEWGSFHSRPVSQEEAVRSALGNGGFAQVDRGSLLRIAKAVEDQAFAAEVQAKEIKALRKEMKEMMKFWKELRNDYRKQKGLEDVD